MANNHQRLPHYDMTNFTIREMTLCGEALRTMGMGKTSMEEVADRIVMYFHDTLLDGERKQAISLARFYKTHRFAELDPELQEYARRGLGSATPSLDMRCLVLLGTTGEEPDWNSRKKSRGHHAIPLSSKEALSRLPMVDNLVSQLGIPGWIVVKPSSKLTPDMEQKTYSVFYVAEALGSPFIPAQQDFVVPYGIKSVLGFGGLLPSGDMFSVILFFKIPVSAETANLFRSLSLNAKMALLPFSHRVFDGNGSKGDTAERGVQTDVPLLTSRIAAIEQLLEVYESSVVEQADKLYLEIAERKRYEDQLEHQSNHDGLTGLPNLNLLKDRIRQALFRAQRHRNQAGILSIDLDQFKLINDSLGHDIGDRLLKITANRIVKCIRSTDTVARQGGDEFAVVLTDLEQSEDAAFMAQKIRNSVSRPITIETHQLEISCSVGISIYPKDGSDDQALLKNADAAMHRAKDLGRDNFQFYTAELNKRIMDRMTMEKHLRRAMERNEFILHYQPQVDFITGRINGMEALIRWQSPELGFTPPGSFIPLAEETGLIVPIGEWVLKTACLQNKAWQDAGLPCLTLAINLSPRQFRQENLVEVVERILRETGLEPRYLELEIVESLLMHDVESAARLTGKLKELGVCMTMDDFGTGYSSLSYLKQFPFDKIKIDRSFIRNITSDPDSAVIARAMIALAHSLRLRVIAEGIETDGQLNYLLFHGCDEMQGFYFSRPIPAQQLEQMLREDRRLPLPEKSAAAPERTLLIVDDEENVIKALKRVFKVDGYRILTAANTAEGFEQLATNRVGVIISDEHMPGMRGSEFLHRVREIYPNIIRIVLTGFGDLTTITEAVNRGAIFKFHTKPWQDETLRESIREAFRYYKELASEECGDSGPGHGNALT
ncbi:MAG: EAL domain-containing protein [Deltaproteobacteria bacterium]|nr:EAL domain-containing protein [Deltaproteobacteria bacterium]